MDPKQTARELYLTIYKTIEDITFEEAVESTTVVVNKVIETLPERIFSPGFIGEDVNKHREFWIKVRDELIITKK